MGPTVLFDKSFIEMLNLDEAAIFDALYSSVICPPFYCEVLADLSKAPRDKRNPEKIVEDVARKTPILHSTPNMTRIALCTAELLGYRIEMGGVPAKAGGRPVRRSNGKVVIVYDESPEAMAFQRWQRREYYALEREFATYWREQLKATRLADLATLAKATLRISASPKSLEDALAIAKEVVNGHGQKSLLLKAVCVQLDLDPSQWNAILRRWKRMGCPRLSQFAPYAAYCLLVDVFFHVAVDKRLISPDRSSNRVDIAYLYYLPFAMVFVSNDNLHKRTAPLFLNAKQLYVCGAKLKTDLQTLDTHYSSLPEDVKAQGLYRIASTPPIDDAYLTTRIWKTLGMKVEQPADPFNPNKSREERDYSDSELRKMMEAANSQQSDTLSSGEVTDPDAFLIERFVPSHRGKWRITPPGVEAGYSQPDREEGAR